MNTVGERIKFQRELLGISQTKLADSVGTSKQTIYKYENNLISNIPSDKLEQIASCLHTTPAWLMGWCEADTEVSADSNNDLSIAEQIKNRRYSLGLSQRDVCDKIGINIRNIQMWESGDYSTLTIERASKLSDVLQCSMSELVYGDDLNKSPHIEVKKDGVWFSLSYFKALEDFSTEQLGWLLDSIMKYAQNGIEPDFSCFENTPELKEMKLAWRFAMSIYEKEDS